MVIKNLMEMSNEHINTVGKKSFIYPNLVEGLDVEKYTKQASAPNALLGENSAYNANYHKRMNLSRAGVQVVVPLKSIEFFASLENVLLPPTKVEITIDIESDDILLYKDAAVSKGKVTIKNIYLCYEKLTLNSANKLLCTKFLSSPQTINVYRESIYTQKSLKIEKNQSFYMKRHKNQENYSFGSQILLIAQTKILIHSRLTHQKLRI